MAQEYNQTLLNQKNASYKKILGDIQKMAVEDHSVGKDGVQKQTATNFNRSTKSFRTTATPGDQKFRVRKLGNFKPSIEEMKQQRLLQQ